MTSRKNASPIGVFDSGIGGLTVVKEIIRCLPDENIVYFGDTARVPYGSKSRKTVLTYSRQIVEFLKTKDVKTIVIACNTASSLALGELEKEADLPIIGVVKPGVKAALDITRNGRIGVIATTSTIGSGLYPELIRQAEPDAEVFVKDCPLLCPLAEEGWIDDEITDSVIRRYLDELITNDIDTLILGCTHYPLLINAFNRILGDSIRLVNPAYETAVSLKNLLADGELANTGESRPEYSFYSSDTTDRLLSFVDTVLGCRIADSGQIFIEKY
ncbi:MAG: glutamate racemase [Lachnospiraceae bacterium]|nr:glutamate racemase [Lachnospiraceae bacterium]